MGKTAPIANREQADAFLLGRINYERTSSMPYRSNRLKLDRMRELLSRLGNPEASMPLVHVAGSKGKGSTATMIAAILAQGDRKVGLYTSPHLHLVEERMTINGAICPPETFVDLVTEMLPAVASMDDAGDPPTYFELTTAMALLHFRRSNVDAAVLEVGLGGRLDSTNVVLPLVSVITSISRDHTRQLGDTIALIAAEKAGIIKPCVPVISGVGHPDAEQVVREHAQQNDSPVRMLGTDFFPQAVKSENGVNAFDYCEKTADSELTIENIELRMIGRHQIDNASLAIATACELRAAGWRITGDEIRAALANVCVPARIEHVAREPDLIIDSAHNPASIGALIATLKQQFRPRRKILVFAASREKEIAPMLEQLAGFFDLLILTKFVTNPRAVDPAELQTLLPQGCTKEVRLLPDPAAAIDSALTLAGPEDLICVTGSFFLAAETSQHWKSSAAD